MTMTTMERRQAQLEIVPAAAALGAEVKGVDIRELDDATFEHIHEAWLPYEHRWAVGDVVVWDNRATLHRREAFDSKSRRVLYAAQMEGHRPYEAPDALDRPAHSRLQLLDS